MRALCVRERDLSAGRFRHRKAAEPTFRVPCENMGAIPGVMRKSGM